MLSVLAGTSAGTYRYAQQGRVPCYRDLTLPRASGRNQSENGPEVRGDDSDALPVPPGIERNLDSAFRAEVSNPEDGGPEPDSQIPLERLQAALEQHRRNGEQQVRDEANVRIQECVLWLTSSRRGLGQLGAVLVTNEVGTRACNTMRAWWVRHEVDSPSQACVHARHQPNSTTRRDLRRAHNADH